MIIGSPVTKLSNPSIVITGNTYQGILTHANTADRTYTFPNNTGTVALLTDIHAPVTLGTANGLSLSGQTLSLGLASSGVTGALSGTDWNTFNSKQAALNGTGFVKVSGTTVSYDNSTYLTGTKVDSFNSRTGAVTLTSSDVTTALNYTPINKAGDTFTGAVALNTGALSAASSAYSSVILVGGLGSPWAGKTYFGDGTGWKYAFSRRSSSVDTDVLTIQDNGNVTSLGNIYAASGVFSSNITTGGRLFSTGQTSPNLHLDPTAGANAVYLNYYAGTGGTHFCNGSNGIVASIDGSGNGNFNGSLTATSGTFSSYLTTPYSNLSTIGSLGISSTANPENGLMSLWYAAISAGKPLYTDEEFAVGLNSVSVYNNSGGTSLTITRVADSQAPNRTGYKLTIAYDGSNAVSPGLGGFWLAINSAPNRTYVQRFRAKIPVGYSLGLAENSQGTNNNSYWLTPTAGTGKWEEYIRVSHCGNTGTFSSGGHVYLNGPAGAVTWYLASCNVYEIQTSGIADILQNGLTTLGPLTATTGTFAPSSNSYSQITLLGALNGLGSQSATFLFSDAGQNNLDISTNYVSGSNLIRFKPGGTLVLTLAGSGVATFNAGVVANGQLSAATTLIVGPNGGSTGASRMGVDISGGANVVFRSIGSTNNPGIFITANEASNTATITGSGSTGASLVLTSTIGNGTSLTLGNGIATFANSVSMSALSATTGTFSSQVSVTTADSQQIKVIQGTHINYIGSTTDSSDNARLTIQGANYTHGLNLLDSYNTTAYAALYGGYYNNDATLTLRKYSAQNTVSATSVYASTYANISGPLTATSGTFNTSITLTGSLGTVQFESSGARLTFSRPNANYIEATDASGQLYFTTAGSIRLIIDNIGTSTFNGPVTASGLITANGGLSATGGNFTQDLNLNTIPDSAVFAIKNGSNRRWATYISGSETGSNAGSDYTICRYTDSGTYVGTAFAINRASGAASFASSVSASQFNGSGAGLTGTASSLTAGNATNPYTAGGNTGTVYLTGFTTSSSGYGNYLYTNSPVYMNAGTVYATNFGATSDERLKTNITPILNPIDKVKNLNGFYFNWNELAPSSDKTTTHVGVSAQHTLKTFPEAVIEGEEYLSVTYNSFIPLLIECVKEQQKEIEELKRLIYDFTK
jgi:hypothetical protein